MLANTASARAMVFCEVTKIIALLSAEKCQGPIATAHPRELFHKWREKRDVLIGRNISSDQKKDWA